MITAILAVGFLAEAGIMVHAFFVFTKAIRRDNSEKAEIDAASARWRERFYGSPRARTKAGA